VRMPENDGLEKYIDFFDNNMRQHYRQIAGSVLKFRQIEGKILDIGSGFGIMGITMCDLTEFTSIIGLEPSRMLVRSSEIIAARRGLSERVSFKIWDENSIPFDGNQFDAVVSFMSLHKWNNLEKTLTEINRVCKKDGIIYIADFHRGKPKMPFFWLKTQSRFTAGSDITENLIDSHNASYTFDEIKETIEKAGLSSWKMTVDGLWLCLSNRA
jgi:ubiquinone/menaquinone biosynthesis C-methylase UbiE